MIFSKRLFSGGHTKEFVVDNTKDFGWEIREEQDNQIVKHTLLHDWHRVENAVMRFTVAAMELERAGWIEIQSPASSAV